MISVIIPLYNKELSIVNTVNSVLHQTYTQFELLIIDDGSTDHSLEYVKNISDNRIKIVEKRNGGVSSARNLGIRNARFNYLAFLDGDDLWSPFHLDELIKLIQHNRSIKFYATGFTKDKKVFLTDNITEPVNSITEFYKEESYTDTILSSSSFAFHKELLDKLTYYYDEKLKYGEDVDFWYRILREESLVYSRRITVYYNIEGENRSNYVLPLHFRFHNFIFENKSDTEKKYLGKLVALVIIDYLFYKSYKISFGIFYRYRRYYKYIFRYFYLLIRKKLKKV